MNLFPVLKTVFPHLDENNYNVHLQMGDIPGWDSMNSVNLQMEIESCFLVDISGFVISNKTTVEDILGIIDKKLY